MPELPEVEIVRQSLDKKIKQKKVKKVLVRNRNLRSKIPLNFAKYLRGKKIIEVNRFSKYLIICLSNQSYCLLHLGMSGTIHLINNNKKSLVTNTSFYNSPLLPKKHNHVEIFFDNFKIDYNDPRRFGFFEIVSEYFSSNFDNSKETGKDLGLADDRVYKTYQEMAEKESGRSDGIDVVAIVTPNHLHVPIAKIFAEKGINIICDKPLALSSKEAIDLKNIVENKKLIFALTHNYTGYPMVRHARSLIQKGDLGSIRVIQAEYPQDWLTKKAEDNGLKQAEWRTDPKRSGGGGCIGDIGTHAYNLIRFITGLEVDEISADIHTFVEGRQVDDNAQIMLRFRGGAKGSIWSSQVAVGNENNLKIRVYGENAGIEWRQEDPNYLSYTKFGSPAQNITRGSNICLLYTSPSPRD